MLSRQITQRIAFTLISLAALMVIVPILLIVAVIVGQGFSAISWDFISQFPHDGMKAGGILPAIVGTLLLTLGTAIMAVPLGVGAGIYLAEYAQDNALTRAIRIATSSTSSAITALLALYAM